MVGNRFGITVFLRRLIDPALSKKFGEELTVMYHLVFATKLAVLVAERVEAMSTLSDDLLDLELSEGLNVLQG